MKVTLITEDGNTVEHEAFMVVAKGKGKGPVEIRELGTRPGKPIHVTVPKNKDVLVYAGGKG